MSEITVEDLKAEFFYDPIVGVFIKKKSRKHAGTNCGHICVTKNTWGYIELYVKSRPIKGHRAAWLYSYGSLPAGDIDHINGNKSDNSLSNLRSATRSQNLANTRIQSNNTSGFRGVFYRKDSGRYRAILHWSGELIRLGNFDTAEEASFAYEAKAKELHGEFYRKFGVENG